MTRSAYSHTIRADGASRGNPGPAGIGAVVYGRSGSVEAEISEFIGTATNNYAEYRAVVAGLQAAQELGAGRVLVELDSELVVRQLTGVYRVKNEALRPLWAQARELLTQLQGTVRHVRREKNREADLLANQAIDALSDAEPEDEGRPGVSQESLF